MKQLYFLICFAIVCTVTVHAQKVYDFETPENTITFQYFGSSLEPMVTTAIPNPDKSGINASATVGKFIKAAGAQTWAGGVPNPPLATPVDGSSGGTVCVKVWMDHPGNVAVKLENPIGGGENWITTQPYTTPNQWQELCFDLSAPSLEDGKLPATGKVYNVLVMFFDFGIAGGAADESYYFDDIKLPGGAAEVITSILDFETAATSGEFKYFGSTLDGEKTEVINNPNPATINTSAKVTKFIKPAASQTWAGAFSDPNPAKPVDLTSGGKICMKVHMDHIGNFALKLENGLDNKPFWIQTVANTKINEWEELCFDSTLPSLEGALEPASGGVYQTITLFSDFGTPGGATDVTNYIDDIVVKTGGVAPLRKVNIEVNMNNVSDNFDKVYVSGTFNNWSGDSNPLQDDDQDGIWKGSLMLTNGAYEYKVTLDNWTKQEQFAGTEECTKTTGEFTNRLLLVAGNTDVPQFCYNSCYACGEEVKITFKLGMGDVVPNPEGVWVAGGGNFDVPGGRFKMSDADNDKIYELVVARKKGFSSYFTFVNGPCPDYSCKENLEGKPCGDASNYNDRKLDPVSTNVVYASCFGLCTSNADCTSAVNELERNGQLFTIVGNPSLNGQLNLVFSENNDTNRKIIITNSVGQVMKTDVLNGALQSASIDLFDFNTGIYYVTVNTRLHTLTQKFVKQ